MRGAPAAVALLLMAGACTPLGGAGTPAATASSVAVQPADLPSGMQRCDLSGDIDSYLKKVQTKDAATYATTKSGWDKAKKGGATAADIEFYSDSSAHCASVETNGSQVSSATYKLVVNYVFQFKDQASAEKGYNTDSILGFSAATLKDSQIPVIEGTATGLGKNSIVLTVAIPNQAIYVAVWQDKQFMVILAILNLDNATDKKASLAENGRIH